MGELTAMVILFNDIASLNLRNLLDLEWKIGRRQVSPHVGGNVRR
jgi:hypothetical protein